MADERANRQDGAGRLRSAGPRVAAQFPGGLQGCAAVTVVAAVDAPGHVGELAAPGVALPRSQRAEGDVGLAPRQAEHAVVDHHFADDPGTRAPDRTQVCGEPSIRTSVRRGGTECVSNSTSWWSLKHQNTKTTLN